LLASFVWAGASQSIRAGRVRERLPQVQARALARPALTVAADLPLSEALRRATEVGSRAVVIVDSTGRPTGVVSEAAVLATPLERRPWVSVGSLARGLNPELVLSADLGGEQLVRAMQAVPATEYLIVEAGGQIRGVLSSADVDAVFAGV
jgi:CBS domain-containing protein